MLDIPVFFLQPDGMPWLDDNGDPVVALVAAEIDMPAVITELDIPDMYGINPQGEPELFSVFNFETVNISRVNRATAVTAFAIVGGVAMDTPNAEINFADEVLENLDSYGVYVVNGQIHIANAGGEIAIETAWLGATIEIVRRGDGNEGTVNSAPQSLAIPARPAAPDAAGISSAEGSLEITGISTAMEYRLGAAGTWVAATGNTAAVYVFGAYHVRYSATADDFASYHIVVGVSPAAPTGLRIERISTFDAVIAWDASEAGISHTVSYTHNNEMRTINAPAGTASVRVLPLAMAVEYTFEVRAVAGGAQSSAVSITQTTEGQQIAPPIDFANATVGDTVLEDGTLAGMHGWHFNPDGNAAANTHGIVSVDGVYALEIRSTSNDTHGRLTYSLPAISSGVFEFSYRSLVTPDDGFFNAMHLIGNALGPNGMVYGVPVLSVIIDEVLGDNPPGYGFEISTQNPQHNIAGTGNARMVTIPSMTQDWVTVRMIVDMDAQLVTILIDDEILVVDEGFRFRNALNPPGAPRFPVSEITGFQMRPRFGGASAFRVTDIFITPQELRDDLIVFDNTFMVEEGTVVGVRYDGAHIGDLTFALTVDGATVVHSVVSHNSIEFVVQEQHIGGELAVVVTSTYEIGSASGNIILTSMGDGDGFSVIGMIWLAGVTDGHFDISADGGLAVVQITLEAHAGRTFTGTTVNAAHIADVFGVDAGDVSIISNDGLNLVLEITYAIIPQ
jgi:hypothetical protein